MEHAPKSENKIPDITPEGAEGLRNYAEKLLSKGKKASEIIQKEHADDALFEVMNLRSPLRKKHRNHVGFKEYAASSVFMTGALHQGKSGPLHFAALDALNAASKKRRSWKKALGEEARAVSVHMPEIAKFFFNSHPKKAKEDSALPPSENLLKMHEHYMRSAARSTDEESRRKLSEEFRQNAYKTFFKIKNSGVPEKNAEAIARYFSNNAHHIVSAHKIIQAERAEKVLR